MKLMVLAVMMAVFGSGCASSVLYSPNGKKLVVLRGDWKQNKITYASKEFSVTWETTEMSHSNAIKAHGEASRNILGGVTSLTTATGAAIAASGVVPILAK